MVNGYLEYIDVGKELQEFYDKDKINKIIDAPPILSERTSDWANSSNRKYIFVSYAHQDFEPVYNDLKRLWSVNANYWYDKEFAKLPTSVNWRDVAENKIVYDKNCVGVLFYVSRYSFVSQAVHYEISACKKRLEYDKDFTYKIVFIEGNDIFDVQNLCNLTASFTSERIINIHSLLGTDNINIKYDYKGIHIYEIAKWFVEKNCINDINFDSYESIVVRKDYLLIGDALISYFGNEKSFSIKKEDKITKISTKAIASPFLEIISIPEGVVEIEDFAIVACKNLKKIIIPSTVQQLSFFALSNFNFESIEISKDNCSYKTDENGFVYTIDANRNAMSLYASPNKNKVIKLILEDSVATINDFAISCCDYLEEIVFSKELKYIGYWSVKENKNLKKITLFPTIEYISPNAFYKTSIKEVRFMGTKNEWDTHSPINETDTLTSYFGDAKITFNDSY